MTTTAATVSIVLAAAIQLFFWGIVPAVGQSTVATNPALAPILRLCDTLAADPEDGARPQEFAGIDLSKVDSASASAACEAAVALAPNEPRMNHNLGRALIASGNLIDAIGPLRAASDAGYGASSRVIGDMYANGQGFSVDLKKADEYYAKAAAAGDPAIALRQVDALLASGAKSDKQKAFDLLRVAADKGIHEAEFKLGSQLPQYDGYFYNASPEEMKEAAGYLAKAYAGGFPGARKALIELQLSGRPFNEDEAFADLVAMAEEGDPWAMTELAERLIISGVGPYAQLSATAQFDAGTEWLKKAAALHYPEALYKLASNYTWGAGSLEENPAEAVRLFREAAELGHPAAAARLGFALYRSARTDAEYAEVLYWFQQARAGGEADGALGLGHLYSTGKGVGLNIEAAIENYSVAFDEGSGVAAYELARIYDAEPHYRDPSKAASYLLEGITHPDGPEDEASAGFKAFSRETKVAVQEALISRGLLKGSADGSFGPASQAAYFKLAGWR